MRTRTWEMDILDWNQTVSDSQSTIKLEYLSRLLSAESEDEARDAYFLISEPVGENGRIYPCAIPVLKTVLAGLPYCPLPAKWECLQLVSTIVSSEGATGYEHLQDECAIHVRDMLWYFLSSLQFDVVENVSVYVDILGILALRFPDLKATIITYIKLAMTREVSSVDLAMFGNTVQELERK